MTSRTASRGSAATVKAGGITVELSRTGKVLFPQDGITKGDLVQHYLTVADRMLPYLRDRPLALARYPDGIDRQRIFQKNTSEHFPAWIRRQEVEKQGGVVRHAVADKPATLAYLANQGCVEFHVFTSRSGSLHHPDQVVVDLDPPDAGGFREACECAAALRELLEGELGLTCFVKTTGGKGLHVHVPLDAKSDFDEVRRFSQSLAGVLARRHPGLLTIEQRRDKRDGLVYADVMRNAYAQTVVAPYTVRARPGAAVATPLRWEEVSDSSLEPGRFTLRTIAARLAETTGRQDPWAGLARRRYGVARAASRLAKLAGD